MKRARVILADDHTLLAEALRKLLEDEFEVQTNGTETGYFYDPPAVASQPPGGIRYTGGG